MDWFQVIILSLTQGLTEFLPVSSSGHLVALQKLFGLSQPPVLFDILLHVGTLGAIVVYFKKDLWGIMNNYKEKSGIIWLVLVGTIPAALVGVLFEKQIESAFNSLAAVGLAFLVTAMLLFATRFLRPQNNDFSQLRWHNAIFVGLFQAVAILPGISRSGSTIVSGLWQGATRETAFRFSFYLAIPAILGALVLKSRELSSLSSAGFVQGLVGMVIAGVVGYFALRILERVLKSAKFFWFGFYCLILGVIILLI